MRARQIISGGLTTFLMFLCLAVGAGAAEYIIKAGGSGPNVYTSLEALRLAGVTFNNGDVISLYNDDSSLTQALPLPGGAKVTIRSAGGRFTIQGRQPTPPFVNGLFDASGEYPNLVLDNVRVANNSTMINGAVYVRASSLVDPNPGATLSISNSIFENNNIMGGVVVIDAGGDEFGTPIVFGGDINATFTNTIFQNNAGEAVNINSDIFKQTTLNINVDQNAPLPTMVWAGKDNSSPAIVLGGDGFMDVNVNVASGKKFDVRGSIDHIGGGIVTLNKNGAGVMKIGYGGAGYIDTNIKEGTLHFGEHVNWFMPFNDMTVSSGAVFKPSITPGNLVEAHIAHADSFSADASYFVLNSFNAAKGAKLEIGGISLMPLIGPNTPVVGDTILAGAWYGLISLMDPYSSSIPSSMNINNKLMQATLEFCDLSNLSESDPDPTTINGIRLHISRVENLATLPGVGDYADVYRQILTLSDTERDVLDSIYARGATNDADLAYLQSLGGTVVMASQLALERNWTSVMRQINKRLTGFQLEDLDITGSDFCGKSGICYQDAVDPTVCYSNIWAYVDQTWVDQDDVGKSAGYKYNPYGIGIGYEMHRDEWIFGGVLRYDDGKIKLKHDNGTNTDVQSLIASLYASWASEGYYISGGLHYGHGWNDSVSNFTLPGISMASRTGNYGTNLYGVNAEVGYMMDMGKGEYPIRVTPYGGLGYASITRGALTEHGGGNFDKHFNKSDWDCYEIAAGVRLAMPIERKGYILIPSLDAAFVRTMGTPGNEGAGDAFLLANPDAPWNIAVLDSNRSALRLSAGLNARIKNNLDVGISYDFEWRKKAYTNQLGLNMSWGF